MSIFLFFFSKAYKTLKIDNFNHQNIINLVQYIYIMFSTKNIYLKIEKKHICIFQLAFNLAVWNLVVKW